MNQPAIHSSARSNAIAAARIVCRAVVAAGKDVVRKASEAGAQLKNLRLTPGIANVQDAYREAGVEPQRASEYIRIHEAFINRLAGIEGCDSLNMALALIEREKKNREGGGGSKGAKNVLEGISVRKFNAAIERAIKELASTSALHKATEAPDVERARECLEQARLIFENWLQGLSLR